MPILKPSKIVVKNRMVKMSMTRRILQRFFLPIIYDGELDDLVLVEHSNVSVFNINDLTFSLGYLGRSHIFDIKYLSQVMDNSVLIKNPPLLWVVLGRNGYTLNVNSPETAKNEPVALYDPCSNLEIKRVVPSIHHVPADQSAFKIALSLWINQLDIRRSYAGMVLGTAQVLEILGDRTRTHLRSILPRGEYARFIFIYENDTFMLDIHGIPHYNFAQMAYMCRGERTIGR